jgi:4,5-DOPA dioxygenase extradiol
VTIGATTTIPLYYDFWGFPQRYYEVTYPAPGAPELAGDVRRLLSAAGHHPADEPARGLDHGAYVPLVELFPAADIPVLQISMPTLDPHALFEFGRMLAPLRDQGVLLIGSGFSTHNLREMRMDRPAYDPPPAWSEEFDDWLAGRVDAHDVDSLLDFQVKAPAAGIAHPRTEHFAPLFVTLGASVEQGDTGRTVIDGFWYGLSKRSLQFG